MTWLKGLPEVPWIAHVLRANQRFNGRLGSQFGAALAYFSVLSIVPILMLAFATTGFVLSELRPDLLELVKDEAKTAVGGAGDAGDQIGDVIDNVLSSYKSIFSTGLLTALYAGAGWIGNLKSAIRAQWRPVFDMTEKKRNLVVETLINIAELFALLLMVGFTFALAAAGTSLNDLIVDVLGLQDVPGIGFVLKLVPVVLSAAAGWVLFMYLYWVFPKEPVPLRARMIGSLIGSIGLGALQYLATALFGVFKENAATGVFGPVITLMLFFNLFGRLILFVAAWIATTEQPAFDVSENKYRYDPYSPVQGPSLPPPLLRIRTLGTGRNAVPGEGQTWVTQDVAKKSVQAGLGAGWVTGIATGAGVGAVIAGLASKLRRR